LWFVSGRKCLLTMNKKTRIIYYTLTAVIVMIIFASGCSKDDPPFFNPVNRNDTTGGLSDIVKDIDGNVYKTVVIGTQTWMEENLRTSKLNDGTPVPNVPDGTQWAGLTTPGYCWYGNNESENKKPFGALYNWYAVNSGKLAPEGWHVPTQEEWTILINYLGGEEKAGGMMKEVGLDYWNSPNSEATNLSGFSARAGGGRYGFCGGSHEIMDRGYWWTATSDDQDYAYYHFLDTQTGAIDNTTDILNYKIFGFSVRCIKD
jgi:uncharacterized protein (TIGR02145 family)